MQDFLTLVLEPFREVFAGFKAFCAEPACHAYDPSRRHRDIPHHQGDAAKDIDRCQVRRLERPVGIHGHDAQRRRLGKAHGSGRPHRVLVPRHLYVHDGVGRAQSPCHRQPRGPVRSLPSARVLRRDHPCHRISCGRFPEQDRAYRAREQRLLIPRNCWPRQSDCWLLS